MAHQPEFRESVSADVRAYADGIKLALRELAHDEPETLRNFVMAAITHMADGANNWVGGKVIAIISGSLVALALFLIARFSK